MSQQINLFNPIFLKQKKYFSAVTMAQALGLILLGGAVLAGYAGYQSMVLRREAAAVTEQLSQTQEQFKKVASSSVPRQKNKLLDDEIKRIEVELKTLHQALGTLERGDLGNTSGYSEYMHAFSRQIVSGLWITGFSLYGAGNEIAIQGKTMQPELVPEYLNRLKREPVLHGKAFDMLEMQRPLVEPKPSPVGASTSTASGASAQPVPAGFVEFKLTSAGIVQDTHGGAGVQVK